ncbi:DNA-3-methyladenine glycosylase I [Botrimarina hoheduenensis]|uniref:DNA-3-methyladenine glycosylase 1 n=1 Tax=Botrimarina hoheduenensis TaxID=2528000 RepID=A0A5C5WBG7_9BACT|nr:DNA-3-methyladenine glycosylase I [Botrimarina hoheduenensis]TWT48266.1 DNA-3-methyladenine glycosylase 1 [Botrimarina hoheduenensis]
MPRCPWAEASASERLYHDNEWGVPSYDNQHLFEMLTLEGAQAGLSWSTILNKRDGYRRRFADFDAAKVARFTPHKIEQILTDPGVVRHRGKIEATVSNARAVIALQESETTLAELLWSFVDGKPIVNRHRRTEDVPAESFRSLAMSKELKRRGFRFVGPTTCYAFMQAVGMVNDHLVSCPRYGEVSAFRKAE